MGDAQANLFAQQMQAALQNQQTGVQASTGLGQVGTAGTTAELGLGQAQQSDPFTAAANYGKIVGGIQAPTTVSNQTQLSPLNTIGSLASAGSGVLNSLFGTSPTAGGLISNTGIMNWLKGLGSGTSNTSDLPTTDAQAAANAATVQANLPSNVNMQQYDAAINGWTQTGVDSSGQPTYVDSNGQPV
jgi:hypothetical protein